MGVLWERCVCECLRVCGWGGGGGSWCVVYFLCSVLTLCDFGGNLGPKLGLVIAQNLASGRQITPSISDTLTKTNPYQSIILTEIL